jgi:hypothetical protein
LNYDDKKNRMGHESGAITLLHHHATVFLEGEQYHIVEHHISRGEIKVQILSVVTVRYCSTRAATLHRILLQQNGMSIFICIH